MATSNTTPTYTTLADVTQPCTQLPCRTDPPAVNHAILLLSCDRSSRGR